MARLTDEEVAEAIRTLGGWTRQHDRIEKTFAFASFPDAMAFVVRLAFEAEAADHHPDLSVHYRNVTVGYWTHSEGGITARDIDGARAADRLAAGGAG